MKEAEKAADESKRGMEATEKRAMNDGEKITEKVTLHPWTEMTLLSQIAHTREPVFTSPIPEQSRRLCLKKGTQGGEMDI